MLTIEKESNKTSRRKFIKGSTILTAGLAAIPLISFANEAAFIDTADNIYLAGYQKVRGLIYRVIADR